MKLYDTLWKSMTLDEIPWTLMKIDDNQWKLMKIDEHLSNPPKKQLSHESAWLFMANSMALSPSYKSNKKRQK